VISHPDRWTIHCDTPLSTPRLNDVAASTTIATSRAVVPACAALERLRIGITVPCPAVA
jgi:hypothetical protein